jgi:hypothetical protein
MENAPMLPNFLQSEIIAKQDGTGSPLALADAAAKPLLLTLGITSIIEQESLDVAVYGSADGATWGDKPLAAFPQKFYCGTYALLLDLSGNPEVKHLRIQWKMSRWGRGEPKPMFGFYVFAQDAASAVSRAVA